MLGRSHGGLGCFCFGWACIWGFYLVGRFFCFFFVFLVCSFLFYFFGWSFFGSCSENILTSPFELFFNHVKPPDRDKLIPENIDKVVLHLRDDGRLQKMHPTSHDKILDRLMFVIRHEVEIAVDGGEPTQESISRSIDMKRLLHGCEDAHQYIKDDYSAVILDAVNTVTGDLRGSRQSYDGCHHVVFFQPNEN